MLSAAAFNFRRMIRKRGFGVDELEIKKSGVSFRNAALSFSNLDIKEQTYKALLSQHS